MINGIVLFVCLLFEFCVRYFSVPDTFIWLDSGLLNILSIKNYNNNNDKIKYVKYIFDKS